MRSDIRHIAPIAASKALVLGVHQTRYALWNKTEITVHGITYGCCQWQVDVRWEMVACGRTRDQVELTERARSYLVMDHRRGGQQLACKKKCTF